METLFLGFSIISTPISGASFSGYYKGFIVAYF